MGRRNAWDIMAGIIHQASLYDGVRKTHIVNSMEINFNEANKYIKYGIEKSWLLVNDDKVFSTDTGKDFALKVDVVKSMWV